MIKMEDLFAQNVIIKFSDMKTEIQIKRKFAAIKKERHEAFTKKEQIRKGERQVSNPRQSIESYNELVAKLTGYLEALNWVRQYNPDPDPYNERIQNDVA